MNIGKIVVTAFVCAFVVGCGQLNYYNDKSNPLLAEVGDNKLFMKELLPLLSDVGSSKDSIEFINNYVDHWVREHIRLREAEKLFSSSQDDIEILVERYRKSLLAYKLEAFYDSKIDTNILVNEMIEYYNTHKYQYKLTSPVVKARVLIVPKDYKKEKNVVKMLNSSSQDDRTNLAAMADREGITYLNFGDDWVFFSDVAKYIPLQKTSFDKYLSENRQDKFADGDNQYFLVVSDYVKSGDYMPMKFVEENIRKSILNTRRKELFKNAEDSIYSADITQNSLYLLKIDSQSMSEFNIEKNR